MHRTVSSALSLQVRTPARLALLMGVAESPNLTVTETMTVTADDTELPVRELRAPHGARVHVVDAPVGLVQVAYDASVDGDSGQAPKAEEIDLVTYLRPSRYAESDRLAVVARAEFAGLEGTALLQAVASWVGQRIAYVSGASRVIDGAVDTLLAGQGVCRDFTHLVIAMLRARDVPARMASAYAPGLKPMDFHAVAEAYVDGSWHVVDATRLAPRSTLLRIATGHDAADTAFLSAYGGELELVDLQVMATVDGDLPVDDLDALAVLA